MNENRIFFRADMLAAIRAGRKTQTRRPIKCEYWAVDSEVDDDGWPIVPSDDRPGTWEQLRCPYGEPGDRLWVRETVQAVELPDGTDCVRYACDNELRKIDDTADAAEAWVKLFHYRKKRGALVPPIHMPRWACRTVLENKTIRVERLQDISEADAIAEGWPGNPAPRLWYERLWDEIYGPGAWAANGHVWVIEFRPIGDEPA